MTVVRIDQTGQLFGRFVKALARGRGDIMAAERIAAGQGWTAAQNALKALVSPLADADALNAAMAPITNDLAALLRPLTIVGRLQGMRPAPFLTRLLRQDVGGSGDWVDEGAPIPVSALGLSDTLMIEQRKCGGIRVLTEELLRSAATGSDQMVAMDAASSLIEAMDTAFISPANGGSTAKPVSITHDATRYQSAGDTVAAIDADLKRLLAVLTGADMSLATAAWMMSPATSTYLSLARGSGGALAYPGMTAKGGVLLGLPVLTSAHVTATGSPGERFIALAEASEILIADEGQGAIAISANASVQMDDAPQDSAQQLVSLWQAGLVGIKAERWVNWGVRRAGAVAVLESVNY